MPEIDDYDLIDQDYDEFIRRGMEQLRWESEHSSHTRETKTHS